MKSKEELKELQENVIHVGMVSTYLMIVEKKTMGEVLELQSKHKKPTFFFLPPIDVQSGRICENEIEDMIVHFIEREDYKKCAELVKIKKIIAQIKMDSFIHELVKKNGVTKY